MFGPLYISPEYIVYNAVTHHNVTHEVFVVPCRLILALVIDMSLGQTNKTRTMTTSRLSKTKCTSYEYSTTYNSTKLIKGQQIFGEKAFYQITEVDLRNLVPFFFE